MALLYELKFPSGKKYIGVTSRTLEQRLKEHAGPNDKRSHFTTKLKNAINKYGVESIEARVIKDDITYDQALVAEVAFIQAYDTKDNGYNITDGGEGVVGRTFTDETIARMKESQRKRFQDPEQRRLTGNSVLKYLQENSDAVSKASNNRKTVVESVEHRKMMSDKMKESYKNNPQFVEASKMRVKAMMDTRPDLKVQISRSLGGKPIEVYKDGVLVDVCDTIKETGRKYSANPGNIVMVLSGKRNHTKGLTFKRKSDV